MRDLVFIHERVFHKGEVRPEERLKNEFRRQKMKKAFRTTLSLLLCIVIAVAGVAPAFAEGEKVDSGNVETVFSEISTQATTSFGDAVKKAIEDNQGKNSNENYYIRGINVKDDSVEVSFKTVSNASLIIAFFDEDSGKMLSSVSTDITAEETDKTITLSDQLPQHYRIRAYIVDGELSALSAEFADSTHTSAYEEFMETSVDSFDEDRVINLDNQIDNNFLVLVDGATKISESSQNVLSSYERENRKYVFENINSEISSLNIGDVLSFENNDGDFDVLKVKSISINGSTAVIYADDAEIEDLFEFIKIDTGSTSDKLEFYGGEDEGVNYEGVVDYNEFKSDGDSSSAGNKAPKRAYDINTSDEFSHSYKIEHKKTVKEDGKEKEVTVSGELAMRLTLQFKLFLSITYREVSLVFDPSVCFKIAVSGKITFEKSCGHFGFTPIVGVFFGINPTVQFSISGEASFNIEVSQTVGFGFGSDGFVNKCKDPTADVKIEISAVVSLGVDFKPQLWAVSEKVLKVQLNAFIGFVGTFTYSRNILSEMISVKAHECDHCISGDINFNVSLSVTIVFFEGFKGIEEKKTKNILDKNVDLGDIYFSISKKQFGRGKCPYIWYPAKIIVVNTSKVPISGATIYLGDGKVDSNYDLLLDSSTVKTDANGEAIAYFKNGNHNIRIECADYRSEKATVKVNEKASEKPARDVNVTLKGNYTVGDIIPFGSYPQSEVTKENDSATYAKLEAAKKNWVSYRYYSGDGSYGSMKQGDWMEYADMDINGDGANDHRAVRFTQYRPEETKYSSYSDSSYPYQGDNGYTVNNIYYFKYEPLKWQVLDPKTGLVLSKSIIDSQAYSNTIYRGDTNAYGTADFWNNAQHTKYANDYATSSIRKWLNEDFFNTAFTSAQKQNILPTTLDNKAFSTSFSKYDSVPTTDNIFLLSYSEVKNASYGFTNDESSTETRTAVGTDYAKAQGLFVASNKCSIWRLRSASISSYYACVVYDKGGAFYEGVPLNYIGIRPALRLSNLATNTGDSSSAKAHSPAKSPVAASFSPNKTNKVYKYYANTVPGRVYMLYAFSGERELSKLEFVTYKIADSDSTIFEYIPRNKGELRMMLVYKDGDKVKQSKAVLAENAEFKIREPSTKTLNYGQTLVLTTESKNMPKGSYTEWVIPNKLAVIKNDWIPITADKTCEELVIAIASTADDETIVNAEGDHAIDYITIECKSNFFLKLIAFFKKLFGISMVLPYLLEGIIK